MGTDETDTPALSTRSPSPSDATPPDATAVQRHDTVTDPLLDAPASTRSTNADFDDRYVIGSVIGEGGMGEILLTRDRRIGRDIALKVLWPKYDANPDAATRFAREARVQGQLEHPAIVPVYDLGVTRMGRTYFTMKRVRGRTLAEIVDGIRSGDMHATRYTLRRLLTAFAQVCLAVDFAHARGVIHRDLKPQNVMLGDFGEVYILDWGIARATADLDPTVMLDTMPGRPPAPVDDTRRIDAGPRRSRDTIDGEMLGSPGYMPPEQASGRHSTVDERADVYALGAILFEIVALEPLHRGDTIDMLLTSTLAGVDARPSIRRPGAQLPPEIDAICVRACALDGGARYASARDLGGDIERYLDGDRDVQRRNEIADAHARDAAVAAERALTPAGTHDDRAVAMQSAGRALALNPSNADATRTMLRLLAEPPHEVPAEVDQELRAAVDQSLRQFASFGVVAYLMWLAFSPLVMSLGVRSWATIASIDVCIASAAVLCWWASRSARFVSRSLLAAFALGTLATIILSRLWGAMIFCPTMLVMHTSLYAMLPGRGRRIAVVLVGTVAAFVPDLAESLGLVSQQTVLDGTIHVFPRMTDMPPYGTRWLPLISCALVIAVAGVAFGRLRDAVRAAESKLRLQSWHMRQLMPTDTRRA